MKSGIALALLLLLVSCSRTPQVVTSVCPPVEGVEQVLSGTGVFIGDMHGSNQSPAFLAALACHAMKHGRPVIAAMEYDAQDQPVLDRFLRTRDADAAMELLTQTPHWTGNADGRASVAMANALRALHGYRHAGGDLRLIAYDFWGPDGQERDRRSAQYLEQLRIDATPGTFWILFGGNVHARKVTGLPFRNAPPGSAQHQPLGYLVRDWELVHLDARYHGGELWGCTGGSREGCSIRDLGPACPTGCRVEPIIRLDSSDPAYDGVYDVSMLSVSRPLHWRADVPAR